MNVDGSAPARLELLFFLPSIDYGGAFESFLRETLERGHEVRIALEHRKGGLPEGGGHPFDELRERYPAFDYQQLPPRRDLWRIPASATRRSLDYLRYLEPDHNDGDPRRARARDVAPRALRPLLFLPPFRWASGRRSLGWLLRRLEAGMPIPRALKSFIRDQAPDLVLVSPLVELGSAQGDCLRAAEVARIPSVLVVADPDDLTSEGVIRDVPTLTVVRDETHVEEAVRLHGLPRERIAAAGAQGSNGLAAPAARGAVEAIESALPTEVVARRQGRLLRPLLWLLTPLLALLLPFLRPRASARAVAKGVRRLIKAARRLATRIRKRAKALRRDLSRRLKLKRAARLARRREVNARKARVKKERERARAVAAKEEQAAKAREAKAREHAAKEEERARAAAAKDEQAAKAREAKAREHAAKEEERARAAAARSTEAPDETPATRAAKATEGGGILKLARSGKGTRKRTKPPTWRRKAVRGRAKAAKAVRGRAKAVRRSWKYSRRGIRRAYNRRYRWTYKRTIMRVPSRDELPVLLNKRGLLGKGAEIGVKTGIYSDSLLSNWHGDELISIDPWLSADPDEYVDRSNVSQGEFERYYQETRERLAPHGSRSTIWRMTSVDAAPSVPDHSLDFVYIDARHDYASVKEDLGAWCSKVRPGGILAGHDYVDGDFPQGEFYVKSAVDEFFGERGIPVHGTEGPSAVEMFPTWVVEVPEEGIAVAPAEKADPVGPAPPEGTGEHGGTPEEDSERSPSRAEQPGKQSPVP